MANIFLSQDILENSMYQSLELTFSSLAVKILAVFFGTHSLVLLDYHPAPKH